MQVTVLIGTQKGAFLLRSDERRSDWKVEGPLFKGWKVTSAGRGLDGEYLLGTASDVYGCAVHKSRNLSEWRQVEAGPRYGDERGLKLNQVWTFGRAGERLFCGVDEAGLFSSDDNGESWQVIEGLTSHPTRAGWFPGAGGMCAHAFLVDPTDAQRMWVGISAVGVFRSEDGGATWTPKNQGVPVIIEDENFKDIGFCVHALTQDPNDADTIWRQDHRGMFRTRDGGDQWERIEEGLPSGFGFPLVQDPGTSALYSFPLESDEYRMPPDGRFRIYRSTDRGDSWHALSKGLPEDHAYEGVLRSAMATDGLSPCGVYAGGTSGNVYASEDGGDTWRRLPLQLPRVLTIEAFVEA